MPETLCSGSQNAAAHRLQLARRRLKSTTPQNVWTLVNQNPRLTPELLAVLLDKVETMRLPNPRRAWEFGQVLPVMVERISWARKSDYEKASWTVRCLALTGELAGLMGRHHEARAYFKRAHDLDADAVAPLASAELHRRRAAYDLRTGCSAKARIAVSQAMALYRHGDQDPEPYPTRDHRVGLGETLFLAGLAEDDPVYSAEALCRCEVDEGSSGRVFDATSAGLAERLGRRLTPDQVAGVFAWLGQARKARARGFFGSERWAHLLWHEARLLTRLGCGRLASRRYKSVWKYFEGREVAPALAVCALDQATALLSGAEPDVADKELNRAIERLKRIDDGQVWASRLGALQGSTKMDEWTRLRRQLASEHLAGPENWYPLDERNPKEESESSFFNRAGARSLPISAQPFGGS